MSSQPAAPRRTGKGATPKEAHSGAVSRSHSQTQARQGTAHSVPGSRRSNESQYAQLLALQDKKKTQRRPSKSLASVEAGDKAPDGRPSKSPANVEAGGAKTSDGASHGLRPELTRESVVSTKTRKAKSTAANSAPHPADVSNDGGSEKALEVELHQKPVSILGDMSMLPSGMSGTFNKTVQALASAAHHVYPWQPFTGGQLSWLLRSEGGGASTGELSTSLPRAIDVDGLEGLLLWQNAWKSAKAFIMGLYLLICIKVYLDSGIHILQPTTVFAGLALCVLIYNSLSRCTPVQGSQAVPDREPNEETFLLHRVSTCIRTVGTAAAVAIPPFVALSSRHLSAPRGPPKFYLAVCLWLVMLVGELKLLFQTSLMVVIWIGLFTLPRLYVENRWLLDGLARAGFAVLIAALRRRHRATLLMAVAGGLTVFWALEITFVVRCTMAMAISGATLLWRVSKCNAK